jgi:hypothetical protein
LCAHQLDQYLKQGLLPTKASLPRLGVTLGVTAEGDKSCIAAAGRFDVQESVNRRLFWRGADEIDDDCYRAERICRCGKRSLPRVAAACGEVASDATRHHYFWFFWNLKSVRDLAPPISLAPHDIIQHDRHRGNQAAGCIIISWHLCDRSYDGFVESIQLIPSPLLMMNWTKFLDDSLAGACRRWAIDTFRVIALAHFPGKFFNHFYARARAQEGANSEPAAVFQSTDGLAVGARPEFNIK